MMTQHPPRYAPVDLDVLQESALSLAQSAIQNAMDGARLKPTELAKRMGRHKSFISRLLSGRHNLTVKTYALALASCGFEPRFPYVPLRWRRSSETEFVAPINQTQTVPAGAGTFTPTLTATPSGKCSLALV
jgi:hypothetical protein